MNSLLDEIEAEHHQTLLESGNLHAKRKASSLWHGSSNYVFRGYFVRVLRATCRNCGCTHDSLMGIFSQETNSLGDKKETALDLRRVQIPGGGIPREYEPVSVPACLDCIP